MENESTKDQFSRRGFLGIGSAALATVAGNLAVSSAMSQQNPALGKLRQQAAFGDVDAAVLE
jgi:nitrous oxide reductase